MKIRKRAASTRSSVRAARKIVKQVMKELETTSSVPDRLPTNSLAHPFKASKRREDVKTFRAEVVLGDSHARRALHQCS